MKDTPIRVYLCGGGTVGEAVADLALSYPNLVASK